MPQSSSFQHAVRTINEALALHQAGQVQQAGELYRQVLPALENSPEALALSGLVHNSLGLALHQQGLSMQAIGHFQKALSHSPDSVDAQLNLGNAQRAAGLLDEAIASFRAALALAPDRLDAHVCLGLAFQAQAKHIQAVECYQKALTLNPGLASVHNNLGTAFQHLLRFENAAASYRQAISLQPDYLDAHCNLGRLFKQFGQNEQAVACFHEVLKIDAQNEVARFEIATLSGNMAERAPDDYVVTIFDEYADKFDAHLQENLEYMVPQKLAALVATHVAGRGRKIDALDVGCGTGLAGVAIAPLCQKLVGVDLSPNMLQKALERNLYQRLVRSDLLSMMQTETGASYDLIIAADVFVYIGKLDDTMAQAARLLRPGGMLAFTFKALESTPAGQADGASQPGFDLQASGRYRHAPRYLTTLARTHGFSVREQQLTRLRTEKINR